jgi:fructokinase
MPTAPTAPLLCYGEILWDFLPEGLFPGGAPANVAYHLARHGRDARLVSAVGLDTLGDELLRRLRHWKLDTRFVARLAGRPTGAVVAELSASGDARYDILPSVAWDQISADPDVMQAAASSAALVFGTLALRSSFNRAALERLLAVLPAPALRVFDVNLRAPHDDLELAHALAPLATLLKVNSAEAARLADDPEDERPGAEEAHARALFARHGCPLVLVTAGHRGAGLLRDGLLWTWEPGREVEVADTIGAGDGFLACFLHHLLSGRSSDGELLSRACRHGEWIATRRGATPAYPPS